MVGRGTVYILARFSVAQGLESVGNVTDPGSQTRSLAREPPIFRVNSQTTLTRGRISTPEDIFMCRVARNDRYRPHDPSGLEDS